MYVYMYTYTYTYTYMYTYMYTYIYIVVYIYVCSCIYIYMYRCIYIYVYIYMCIYMYIYIGVYIYMYIYICVYIYNIYISVCACVLWTYTSLSWAVWTEAKNVMSLSSSQRVSESGIQTVNTFSTKKWRMLLHFCCFATVPLAPPSWRDVHLPASVEWKHPHGCDRPLRFPIQFWPTESNWHGNRKPNRSRKVRQHWTR